eukprot:m.246106 g.246106  ORF g.246106 m.246106 type:complete len:127 (-) comp19487_c0_seq9:760-1140(-)
MYDATEMKRMFPHRFRSEDLPSRLLVSGLGGVRSASFVYSALLPAVMRGANLTQMTHITDWYNTFCTLAGVNPADDREGVFPIDSVDLWPLLTGETTEAPRDTVILGHDFAFLNENHTGMTVVSLH